MTISIDNVIDIAVAMVVCGGIAEEKMDVFVIVCHGDFYYKN